MSVAARMNRSGRTGDEDIPGGLYFLGMKATDRALTLDVSLGVVGIAMTAVAVWYVNVIGAPFAGAVWLKIAWPVLIGAPLVLRRQGAVWAGPSSGPVSRCRR